MVGSHRVSFHFTVAIMAEDEVRAWFEHKRAFILIVVGEIFQKERNMGNKMKKEHVSVNIECLVPNPENAKLHRDDLIEKSIDEVGFIDDIVIDENNMVLSGHGRDEVGFIDDIVIDENNMVLSGHGRLDALKKKGFKEVDCIKVLGLSEEQKKKYILLANKSVEAGGWDFEVLKKNHDWDLLQYAGFESEELEAVFGIEVNEDDFKAPEQDEKEPDVISKRGDIYQLGRHRVMCGDSTVYADYEKLMDGKKGRLVFTDPPYNVGYESRSQRTHRALKKAGGKQTINSYSEGKYQHIKNFEDDKSEDDCLKFYSDVLQNLYVVTEDDACIYWWFASVNHHINRQAFLNAGWRIHQNIIWVKEAPLLSRLDYMGIHEPCLYGWKQGKKHYSHRMIRNIREVWNLNFDDFVELMDVWYERRDNTAEYMHPTQKPVRLSERALKLSSEKGDVVLDVFGGSGSTLIGCEQVDRICYMMELDPFYVDVIVRRWEEFTGQKAKLI